MSASASRKQTRHVETRAPGVDTPESTPDDAAATATARRRTFPRTSGTFRLRYCGYYGTRRNCGKWSPATCAWSVSHP